VNAQSTKVLYEKRLAAHPDGKPLYVVCDNARYDRNQELAEWRQDKPLVQVFLAQPEPDGALGEVSTAEVLSPPVFIAPRAHFAKLYAAFSTGSTSLGTTSRPYSPSTFTAFESQTTL
jgi:hypothetical protein